MICNLFSRLLAVLIVQTENEKQITSDRFWNYSHPGVLGRLMGIGRRKEVIIAG